MDESWGCLVSGRLARSGEMDHPRYDPAFVNTQNEVQFNILALTPGPPGLHETDPERPGIYTCYAKMLRDFGFEDNYYLDADERVRSLQDFLRKQVIVFKPLLRNNQYLIAHPVHVGEAPTAIQNAGRLLYFPAVSAAASADLQHANGVAHLGRMRSYPDGMPPPETPFPVLLGGRWLVGPFSEASSEADGWHLHLSQGIKMAELSESDLLEHLYVYENLALAADRDFHKMNAHLERHGTDFDPERLTALPAAAGRTVIEAQPLPAAEAAAQAARVDLDAATDNDEVAFLKDLATAAQSEGLLYDDADLVHFHTSLKAGGLVLLAGMAGIGKSQLPRVYAKALGLGSEAGARAGRLLVVPVRATWSDEADVFGFLDAVHGLYQPSETGLVDLFLEAAHHPDRLYMVCFDEMNLARAEHYLAPLLSLMSLPLPLRRLDLYNPNVPDVRNAAQYPARVTIGANVLLVGTVNLDESTHTMTDRLLDRANSIEPRMLPFSKLLRSTAGASADDVSAGTGGTVGAAGGTGSVSQRLADGSFRAQERGWIGSWAAHFPAWRRAGAPDDVTMAEDRPNGSVLLSEQEVAFFQELHSLLHEADNQLGVSFRTVRQVDRYLANLPGPPDKPILARGAAFDAQVVQRILPRLRGPREALRPLLGRVVDDELRESALADLFDRYSDVSMFERCRARVQEKARTLQVYGYAS